MAEKEQETRTPPDERETRELLQSERFFRQLLTLTAGLLTFVLLVYVAERFATILQQFLIAAFLAYLVLPAHRYLSDRKVPWLVSVVLLTSLVVGCFAGLGILIGDSFDDLQARLPGYQQNLRNILNTASAWIPGMDHEDLDRLVRGEFTPARILTHIRTGLSRLSGFLSQTFVVLIYFAFLLAELSSIRLRLERAFEPDRSKQVQEVVKRINDAISQYIVIKTMMSLLTGVLTTLVLFLLDVDYAVLWGLIAFLLNYVPYLGSVVAVSLPVLLSVVQGKSFLEMGMILTFLVVAHNSVYLIEPHIQGSRLNLSPLVLILSLAFWGTLWGIIGMILAIPLIVVIKTILENIPATRPLAVLLSNR